MQTPVNTEPWINGASANLNISTADQEKASNLFHEFQRLDWWSDYSDDGGVQFREMNQPGTLWINSRNSPARARIMGTSHHANTTKARRKNS